LILLKKLELFLKKGCLVYSNIPLCCFILFVNSWYYLTW